MNTSKNISENISMNIEAFTENVMKHLREKLGEAYSITSDCIKKNNGIELIGLMIKEKGCNASPAVYMDDFYEEYKRGESFETIVEGIFEVFVKNRFPEPVDLSRFMSYEKAKSQIAFKLINYEKNWKILQDVPHRVFLNLAVVFYYMVEEAPFCGNATILIHHSHVKRWGITEEELYRRALENTPRLLPARITGMNEVVIEMFEKNRFKIGDREETAGELLGFETMELDEMLAELQEEIEQGMGIPMSVLSNEQKLQGAACMLYPGVLKEFAEKKKSDLIILPSSVHEVLLIAASENDSKEELLDMVMEMNRTQVDESEVLADAVYYFSRKKNRIERFC